MMTKKLTAAQRRYNENALLITALRLIFHRLVEIFPSVQIGELARTTSGGTPLRSMESYFGGNIPWIKSGELNDGIITASEEYITEAGLENSSAKVFPKGTLVVALYGATVGKTGILGLDTATNQAVCAIFPKSNVVFTEFLYWFFRYKRPEFLGNSFGGAQPNISQKVLRATEIPLPPKNLQETICNFLRIVENRQKGNKAIDYPPLPPEFSDVRRIVARVEALAERVRQITKIRADVEKEIRSLLLNVYHNLVKDAEFMAMGNVAPLVRRPVEIDPTTKYYELGVRSFGRGTFHKPSVDGFSVGSKKLYHIKPGDLVFSNVFAWEGAIAVAQPEDDGRVGSHRFITCVPKENIALPEFLCFHFLTPQGLEDIRAASPGGAGRNRTLGLKKLAAIQVPIPSYEKQLWFKSLLAKVNALCALQSQTQAELDALLPSVLDRAFRGEL